MRRSVIWQKHHEYTRVAGEWNGKSHLAVALATGPIENKAKPDRQKIGAPLALPYVADAQVFEPSSLGDDLGLSPSMLTAVLSCPDGRLRSGNVLNIDGRLAFGLEPVG